MIKGFFRDLFNGRDKTVDTIKDNGGESLEIKV